MVLFRLRHADSDPVVGIRTEQLLVLSDRHVRVAFGAFVPSVDEVAFGEQTGRTAREHEVDLAGSAHFNDTLADLHGFSEVALHLIRVAQVIFDVDPVLADSMTYH